MVLEDTAGYNDRKVVSLAVAFEWKPTKIILRLGFLMGYPSMLKKE